MRNAFQDYEGEKQVREEQGPTHEPLMNRPNFLCMQERVVGNGLPLISAPFLASVRIQEIKKEDVRGHTLQYTQHDMLYIC